MLNLVPIQFLALFGYAILRIVVGLVWCHLALQHHRERANITPTLSIPLFPYPTTGLRLIIVIESIIGVLFVLGFLTQLAALLSILWCLKLLILRKTFHHPSFPNKLTTVLLLAIALNLFITGAGLPAFDLPV